MGCTEVIVVGHSDSWMPEALAALLSTAYCLWVRLTTKACWRGEEPK